MPSRGARLRAGALLAVGALVLHQIRYRLSYGGHYGDELAAQGHSYLDAVTPVLLGLLSLVFVQLLLRVARPRLASGADAVGPSLPRLWALASTSLLLLYCAQEWVEGALYRGHPSGVEALLGHGGWMAAALAALVALVLRGATAVELAVARRRSRFARARPARRRLRLARKHGRLDPVARFLAARGPPASFV